MGQACPVRIPSCRYAPKSTGEPSTMRNGICIVCCLLLLGSGWALGAEPNPPAADIRQQVIDALNRKENLSDADVAVLQKVLERFNPVSVQADVPAPQPEKIAPPK